MSNTTTQQRVLIIFLVLILLMVTPQKSLGNNLNFQLNDRGLILLVNTQAQLGPFSFFLSPWLISGQNETSYGLRKAGLDLGIGSFHLTAGRQLVSFGPGRYLFPILSPLGKGLTAEGLDQIGYNFSTRNLKYYKFYAWVPNSGFRILLGQRTTLNVGPFTLGYSETALAKEGAPNFYYLPLPFIPVAFYQFLADHTFDLAEADGALNLLAELDLTLRLAPQMKIYAGYLVDNRPLPYLEDGSYYYWRPPAKDSLPWQVGYQYGLEWGKPLGIPGIKLYTEYTRINQFTYTNPDPFFNYTYKGTNLGGPLGPDADQLNIELVSTSEGQWQYGFAFSRKRQGEGKIGDQWTYQPGETEVFLTGTVETTDSFALSATKSMGESDAVTLTISIARLTNPDHLPGSITYQPAISVLGKVSWE